MGKFQLIVVVNYFAHNISLTKTEIFLKYYETQRSQFSLILQRRNCFITPVVSIQNFIRIQNNDFNLITLFGLNKDFSELRPVKFVGNLDRVKADLDLHSYYFRERGF